MLGEDGKVVQIDESGVRDLRASDLLSYFKKSGRHTRCPHCDHVGIWEFHIKIDEEGRADADPILIPFKLSMDDRNDEAWTKCAAITCPNCGHVALISMYKIAAFKESNHEQ
ncbi:hypothetical protein [Pseudomonas flexibilis]|uniref:hypothetical protein n=1 Tax=Pseudomonas flexibilis TaxID=706570 RepID=UPI001115AC09|nr:hypothetical protein [Pseudomonas flexibilis]